MASDREHPSPQHRVAHFLATVEDYERLQRTFPLPTELSLTGHGDDDPARWIVILHALLLRKYFAGDELQLKEVAKALRKCVVKNDYPEHEWEEIFENVGKYQTTTIYGDDQLTETEVFTHYLYGRYLHGDFGKWVATEGKGMSLPDDANWKATHARSRRVLLLAEHIRSGIEEGAVVLEASSS